MTLPDRVISIYLGTVADVPGLAAELVASSRAAAGWAERLGRARSGDPNGFVAGLFHGRLPYDAQLWVRLRTMPR